MSDNDVPEKAEESGYRMAWRHAPSYFVDGVVGIAGADGVHRIALGQINFNPMPDATGPLLTPVCHLMVTTQGAEFLIQALQDAIGEGGEENVADSDS